MNTGYLLLQGEVVLRQMRRGRIHMVAKTFTTQPLISLARTYSEIRGERTADSIASTVLRPEGTLALYERNNAGRIRSGGVSRRDGTLYPEELSGENSVERA